MRAFRKFWSSPSRLANACLLSRQLQQFRRLNVQNSRELADDLKAGIAAAFFELAHVSAVHVRFVRKVFLREAFRMAEPAQIGGKDLAQIHAPSETWCWLLTRRFKQTKCS